MFQIGDTVLYGAHGVCRVEDISECDFAGTQKEYYILRSLSGGERIYVPTDSEKLLMRMRRVLSRDEILHLAHSAGEADISFNGRDSERKLIYKELLEGADTSALVSTLKTVLSYREALAAESKKLHSCDERFIEGATKALYEEFSLVLEISREELVPLLFGNGKITG